MNDCVDTAYGCLNKGAVMQVQATFDRHALLQHLDAVRQLSASLQSERGLQDSLMRLYCMAATVLVDSAAWVPPEDGDLSALLRKIRFDLDDAISLLQSCLEVIEPLERLQNRQADITGC